MQRIIFSFFVLGNPFTNCSSLGFTNELISLETALLIIFSHLLLSPGYYPRSTGAEGAFPPPTVSRVTPYLKSTAD